MEGTVPPPDLNQASSNMTAHHPPFLSRCGSSPCVDPNQIICGQMIWTRTIDSHFLPSQLSSHRRMDVLASCFLNVAFNCVLFACFVPPMVINVSDICLLIARETDILPLFSLHLSPLLSLRCIVFITWRPFIRSASNCPTSWSDMELSDTEWSVLCRQQLTVVSLGEHSQWKAFSRGSGFAKFFMTSQILINSFSNKDVHQQAWLCGTLDQSGQSLWRKTLSRVMSHNSLSGTKATMFCFCLCC